MINIARQLDDYRAVSGGHATSTGSTPSGSCYGAHRISGGHVLELAAADARIAAVIAQGPYTDSIATLMTCRPELSSALWWRACVISSEHGWAAHPG